MMAQCFFALNGCMSKHLRRFQNCRMASGLFDKRKGLGWGLSAEVGSLARKMLPGVRVWPLCHPTWAVRPCETSAAASLSCKAQLQSPRWSHSGVIKNFSN